MKLKLTVVDSSIFWAGYFSANLVALLAEMMQWWRDDTGLPGLSWALAYSFMLVAASSFYVRACNKEQEAERDLMNRARENIERMENGPF